MTRLPRFAGFAAAVLLACVVGTDGLVAQGARNATLAGEPQPPGSSDFAARAAIRGDVAGELELRIRLSGDIVIEGGWTLVTDEGVLRGTIVTGTVSLVDGHVSSLRSLQLLVDGGTQAYADVIGSGTLDATIARDAAPSLTGGLALTF